MYVRTHATYRQKDRHTFTIARPRSCGSAGSNPHHVFSLSCSHPSLRLRWRLVPSADEMAVDGGGLVGTRGRRRAAGMEARGRLGHSSSSSSRSSSSISTYSQYVRTYVRTYFCPLSYSCVVVVEAEVEEEGDIAVVVVAALT